MILRIFPYAAREIHMNTLGNPNRLHCNFITCQLLKHTRHSTGAYEPAKVYILQARIPLIFSSHAVFSDLRNTPYCQRKGNSLQLPRMSVMASQINIVFNILFKLTTKKSSKLHIIDPLFEESTGDWWIHPSDGETVSTSCFRETCQTHRGTQGIFQKYN